MSEILGGVEHVVPVQMLVDLRAELLDPARSFGHVVDVTALGSRESLGDQTATEHPIIVVEGHRLTRRHCLLGLGEQQNDRRAESPRPARHEPGTGP